MKKAGYVGVYFGENIAWGTGPYATPADVVRRWMSSSGHRQNILGDAYDHLGAGVAIGNPTGSSGATFTTTFGGR